MLLWVDKMMNASDDLSCNTMAVQLRRCGHQAVKRTRHSSFLHSSDIITFVSHLCRTQV